MIQNQTTKTINKQSKEKQKSSQSHTNSEGHITANEYGVCGTIWLLTVELTLSPLGTSAIIWPIVTTNKTNSVTLSPQANYTD
jgi:hypothetical protein